MIEPILKIEKDVHVVKSKFFRYRLVYPIKDENGKINWFNLLTGGSWGNLIMVIIICSFLVGLVLAYRADVMHLVECCNSACQNLFKNLPATNAGGYHIPNISLVD